MSSNTAGSKKAASALLTPPCYGRLFQRHVSSTGIRTERLQAYKKVEAELRKIVAPPSLFGEIDNPKLIKWFTSIWLAGILIAESVTGLVALFQVS